jgi:hypothetical protein
MLALLEINELNSFTKDEWLMMQSLIEILAPLESATRNLCGESYSTASMIIPTIRAAINHLTKFTVSSAEVMKFRACLVVNLNDRFASAEANKVTATASILDPRFKEASFKSINNAKYAKEVVLNLLSMVKLDNLAVSSDALAVRNSQASSNLESSSSCFDILSCI